MSGTPPGWLVRVPLEKGDVGPAGHISNVGSVRVLDAARRVYFGLAGPAAADGLLAHLGGDVGHLLARHTIQYKAEYWYSIEPVTVRLQVTGIGRTSFRVESRVSVRDDGPPVVVAEAVCVLVERPNGRSWPLEGHDRAEFIRRAFPAAPA